MEPNIQIVPTIPSDAHWIRPFIREHWGDEIVVAHGDIYYPHQIPGFIARDKNGSNIGLATFQITPPACELVTIDAVQPRQGVGTALLDAVIAAARQAGCTHLWLITTNDNLDALAFYQKRGFHLVAVHPNALEQSRKVKPSIPMIGANGILLRDEIELELLLD